MLQQLNEVLVEFYHLLLLVIYLFRTSVFQWVAKVVVQLLIKLSNMVISLTARFDISIYLLRDFVGIRFLTKVYDPLTNRMLQ